MRCSLVFQVVGIWCLSVLLPGCETTGPGKALFFDNISDKLSHQVQTPDIQGLEGGFSFALWAREHRPADSAHDNFAGFSGTILTFIDEAETHNIIQFAEYDALALIVGADDIIFVWQNGDDVDWHHYGFTYDDTSGIFNFYRDGSLTWTSENQVFHAAHTGFMGPGHFQLGKSIIDSDTPYTGFIDEFCVWNTPLDDSTIQLIKSYGCMTPSYDHSSLIIRFGFDNDIKTEGLGIWNDATSSYYASDTSGTICTGTPKASSRHPTHIISTAPFESDVTPLWVVISRSQNHTITLLCHGCFSVNISSLPQHGHVTTLSGTILGVSNTTDPVVVYVPDGSNVSQDSFSYQHGAEINATVVLETNTPPPTLPFSISLSQNDNIVISIPAKGTSIDSNSGPPTSSWIVSISSPPSLNLYQIQDSPSCDPDNWDFYTCTATPTNLIPTDTTEMIQITDPFNRIGISHQGSDYGNAIMSISFRVFDGLEFSNTTVVSVDVVEAQSNAYAEVGGVLNATEDTPLNITIDAFDPAFGDIFTFVSQLPAHGSLYQVDLEGRISSLLTTNPSSATIDQWASSAVASSHWANPIDYPDQIVGPPDVYPNHGDLAGAWQPQQSGDFSKQWIQINISQAVYVSTIHVFETWHPGSLVRVKAYAEESQSWHVLWEGETQVPLLNPDPTVHTSGVSSPDMCPATTRTRQLYFDLDLSSDQYWAAWDAVQVSGSVLQRENMVLHPDRRLIYIPNLNYNGPDNFSVTILDCPFFLKYRTLDPDSSRTTTISLLVSPLNDPPVVCFITASLFDGPHSSLNISLMASDVDDNSPELFFSVTVLPSLGHLLDELGNRISVVPTRLPGFSNTVVYVSSKITTQTKHTQEILFTYTATDPHGASGTNQVQLTVQSCVSANYTYNVSSVCDFSTIRRALHIDWGEHSECQDYDFGITSLPCDHIPASSSVGVVVTIITCFSAGGCLFWMIWLGLNRTIPIVRASQVLLCVLFVVGGFALCLSNLVFLGPNNDRLCMARAWLFHVTFTFMFAPLTVKIWRAYQVLQNSAFKRKIISTTEVLTWLGCMTMVDVVLLALWTGISPLKSTQVTTNTAVGPVANSVCSSAIGATDTFAVLLAATKVLMCTGACFWSFLTRNVSQKFAESKHIMIAVYITGVVGGTVAFVVYVAGIGNIPGILTQTIGICGCVVASVCVVIMPKYFARHLTTQDLIVPTNRKATRQALPLTSSQKQSFGSSSGSKTKDTEKQQVQQVEMQTAGHSQSQQKAILPILGQQQTPGSRRNRIQYESSSQQEGRAKAVFCFGESKF